MSKENIEKKQALDRLEEGYCLQRTRQRLARLGWALLYLFIGAACGVFFFIQITEERSGWEFMDYFKLVVSGLIALGAVILGIYEAFTDIRDALFPEKSRLAKSIRSQLPYPDAAPDIKELFGMVDKDIRENGLWFDRVAVGREWVFGDEVSYIPRIRIVFGRDEIVHRHTNGKTQTSRIIELYIMDDRKQVQITDLRNPNELKSLLDCLKLRAPGALFRPYSEYHNYCGKSDIEWENLLREFQHKKNEREFAAWEAERTGAQISQNMILTRSDGSVTSRVTPDFIRQTIADCIAHTDTVFFMTPSRPISGNQRTFMELECDIIFHQGEENYQPEEFLMLLKQIPPYPGGQSELGMSLVTNKSGAEAILCTWLEGRVPDLHSWNLTELRSGGSYRPPEKAKLPPPCLILVAASGARQSHETFTREDVEVAAEGLIDGSYQSVELSLGKARFLWMLIETGDKIDGRCKVSVTRPDPDKLRFFTTRCTHRQAAAWLIEFYEGHFRPEGADWKDYTRQVEKNSRK